MLWEEVARGLFKEYCGSRMLDVGCGYGASTLLLASVCRKSIVVCIDISYPKLTQLVSRTRDIHSNVLLVNGNAGSMPFKTGSFDIVVAVKTLHEIEKAVYVNALKEIQRVLADNGFFVVADRVMMNDIKPSERIPVMVEQVYHMARRTAFGEDVLGIMSVGELVARVESIGFKRVMEPVIVDESPWISGERFLKVWAKGETFRVLSMLPEGLDKRRLESVVDEIKVQVLKYGYGPAKMAVAVFTK